MQPFAACVDEGLGLGCGVVIENGRLIHVAMHQPHGVSVFEVDGGVKDHGGHLSDFAPLMHGDGRNAIGPNVRLDYAPQRPSRCAHIQGGDPR